MRRIRTDIPHRGNGGRVLIGTAVVAMLAMAPTTYAQGTTTGPGGAVTVQVGANSVVGRSVTVAVNATSIPVPFATGGRPPAPSVAESVTLPQGAAAGTIVNVIPQSAASVLSSVSGSSQLGNISGSTAFTIKIQSASGEAVPNTQVQLTVQLPAGTTSTPQVFQIRNVNGARTLVPVAASIVNGKLIVTETTDEGGTLDLVLGATLSAPDLARAQAPVAVVPAAGAGQSVGVGSTARAGAELAVPAAGVGSSAPVGAIYGVPQLPKTGEGGSRHEAQRGLAALSLLAAVMGVTMRRRMQSAAVRRRSRCSVPS